MRSFPKGLRVEELWGQPLPSNEAGLMPQAKDQDKNSFYGLCFASHHSEIQAALSWGHL